jgi:hypothetical protein
MLEQNHIDDKFKEIAEKIIAMKNADLAIREKLVQSGQLSKGYHDEMKEMHHKNALELNEIIDDIGYPTIDKVGKEASEASWLVIQHAIGQPAFMKKCLLLLERAVNECKADPIDLAHLKDRILVFQERPQFYGTQYDWDEKGELSPNIMDDAVKVDERRKSIGLNSIEEQTKVIRNHAKLEKQTPPEDFEKRKQEIEAWKIEVGWKN